jgi:hypothetical protein
MKSKFPDVANWVGAIDRNIGVAFRYDTTIAITCVASWLAKGRVSVDFKAEARRRDKNS